MESIQVGFSYGILAKSLEEQANEQGFTLGEKADNLQKSLKYIHHLYMSDLLTDTQEKTIINKLHKKVINNLERV